MTISMYSASVPLLTRSLTALGQILAKGAAFAAAKKIDESVLLNARLAPDMFALARQVQIASDTAKGCVARLAGVDVPGWADTEATFAELEDRVQRTIDFIGGFTAGQIDGSEDKAIVLKFRTGEQAFTGYSYLTTFVLPNVYFHATTTYAILRHNGVELGKRDYLGA
jgi:hypothetical protein